MRNLIIILGIMALSVTSSDASAQVNEDYRHTLSAGGGGKSTSALSEEEKGVKESYKTRPINKYSGTFTATYRYVLTNKIAVGIAASFDREAGAMREFESSGNTGVSTTHIGDFKRNVFTVAPEILINYTKNNSHKKTDHFNIAAYGYLGIGCTFVNELDTYDNTYFLSTFYNGISKIGKSPQVLNNRQSVNVQLCLIGISLCRRIGGFAELGYGYKGILTMGCQIKL